MTAYQTAGTIESIEVCWIEGFEVKVGTAIPVSGTNDKVLVNGRPKTLGFSVYPASEKAEIQKSLLRSFRL